MKCFYLPGAPLNLTHDKALTDNVLMMRPADWCAAIQESGWVGGRLTFCQPKASRGLVEYRPHRHHHQNNYHGRHRHRMSSLLLRWQCSSTRACLPSSSPILPSCVLWWTDVSFSPLHLSFTLSLSSSVSSFISANRWFSPCLCFALRAISQSFSLQKVIAHWAHQPGVNSLQPLTDESEEGAVATLTASSEEKHINGSASRLKMLRAGHPVAPTPLMPRCFFAGIS